MTLPYFIAVSDGTTIHTIHPPALGEHRAAVEAALAAVLDTPPEVGRSIEATKAMVDLHYDMDDAHRSATIDMLTQGEIARGQGFTGDSCIGCGGFSMRRNGTCLLCTDCGATTGCS